MHGAIREGLTGGKREYTSNRWEAKKLIPAYSYKLRYRRTSAFTTIATGATGPKRAQPLGQLDTTGLALGDYIVEVELVVPGQEPIAVRRPFTITGP